jgi:hypothetical protein
MDTVFAVLTIAVMLSIGTIAGVLLTKMFKTIRDLRGVSTGLNDTLRWAVGRVAADPAQRPSSADGAPTS